MTPGRASKMPCRAAGRGQSTAEFLVALLALVPIYFGVVYVGKYGDIRQAAAQSSRYAAFQRATEPSTARLSDATLQDQVRARFFASGDYAHQGKLQSDDSAVAFGKSKGQRSLWRDQSFKQLLPDYDSVTLSFGSGSLGQAEKVLEYGGKLYGLKTDGLKIAQVEVALLNRMDQTTKSPPLLKIGAATAAAGGAWNAGGSKDVRDRIAPWVPSSMVPKGVDSLLKMALKLFEDTDFELGCIKPDVVPASRLKGYAPNDKCM